MKTKVQQHIFIKVCLLLIVSFFATAGACTKVVTYGKDFKTNAISHTFSSNSAIAMELSKKALETLGYKIENYNLESGQIVTGWQPTTSGSHFLRLFKRKDYSGNAGVYYQFNVVVTEQTTGVLVSAYTTIKSIVGPLESSKQLENKFFKQLKTYMRSPQIIMTNVSVEER